MSDLIHIGGWDLVREDGEEAPRVPSIKIADKLGYAQARDIRKLIERNRKELEQYGAIQTRATVARIGRQGRGSIDIESIEYLLNEGQALCTATLSRTPLAAVVRKELIEIFIAWRNGRLVQVPAGLESLVVAAVRAAMAERDANNGLIGAGRAERLVLSELREICTLGAQRGSKSWRAQHRKLQNELRDLQGVGHRGAWRDLPERHLGDVRSRLVLMRQDAEREDRSQTSLFLVVGGAPALPKAKG